jgi:conjugative transposon TraM protein
MTNNNQTNGNNPGMSQKQKELIKKYAVFAIMGIIFAGCMYLILSPSADKKAKQEQTAGFNVDIPMPRNEDIIDDKPDAYQKEQMKQRQDERMRSLQDFSALLGDGGTKEDDGLTLVTDAPAATRQRTSSPSPSRQQSSMQSSTQAYRDMNRTLGSFYETPREDPEKERMREELEEMKNRLDETENRKNPMEEQMEFMEKSFQMATKYMPGLASTGEMGNMGAMVEIGKAGEIGETGGTPQSSPTRTTSTSTSRKEAVTPVTQVRTQTVSALLPQMSDAEFMETYSKPRNMSFLTATSEANAGMKNTVSACIYADQTVMDGQNVRLRLLEAMQVGNVVIPRNTLLTGTARITGERLGITIVSLEHAGTVMFVGLRVYDLDGQSGVFIPNISELKAAKEIVANMGTSAGTSISLSTDAGKQFAADMGRNVIQGVSQYTAKTLREVKVSLKDGYKVYLINE